MESRRHPYWKNVPDERWNDWKWQQSQRVRSIEVLKEIFPEAVERFDWTEIEKAAERFPMGVTPYYLSLVEEASWKDPIWRQVVPSGDELQSYDDALEDPLAEEILKGNISESESIEVSSDGDKLVFEQLAGAS